MAPTKAPRQCTTSNTTHSMASTQWPPVWHLPRWGPPSWRYAPMHSTTAASSEAWPMHALSPDIMTVDGELLSKWILNIIRYAVVVSASHGHVVIKARPRPYNTHLGGSSPSVRASSPSSRPTTLSPKARYLGTSKPWTLNAHRRQWTRRKRWKRKK